MRCPLRAKKQEQRSVESEKEETQKREERESLRFVLKRVKIEVYLIDEGKMESFKIFIKPRLTIPKMQLLRALPILHLTKVL